MRGRCFRKFMSLSRMQIEPLFYIAGGCFPSQSCLATVWVNSSLVMECFIPSISPPVLRSRLQQTLWCWCRGEAWPPVKAQNQKGFCLRAETEHCVQCSGSAHLNLVLRAAGPCLGRRWLKVPGMCRSTLELGMRQNSAISDASVERSRMIPLG